MACGSCAEKAAAKQARMQARIEARQRALAQAAELQQKAADATKQTQK